MGRKLDEMTFDELIHALADLENSDGPLELEQSIERAAIDRRLMRLLSNERAPDERRATMRVPGPLGVRLFIGERAIAGTIVDLGEGGLRMTSPESPAESDVEVELSADGVLVSDHPPRARARISWRRSQAEGFDLGLQFVAQNDAHRRRLRRLVLEILRRM